MDILKAYIDDAIKNNDKKIYLHLHGKVIN